LSGRSMAKPSHKLLVPGHVAALVRTLHPHLKKKIRASLNTLLSDPAAGKKLEEELTGLRSFRVSRYRIIYRISPAGQVELVAIGPRDRIYEETYRLLKKEQER
jgi:mRNA interferase RelE/StbE